MAMKGFSSTIAAILMLVILAVMITSMGITWWLGEGSIQKATLHKDLYTMDTALKAAKLYADTAFHYSTYQALHDVGAHGGLLEIPADRKASYGGKDYAYWYKNKDLSPSEEAFTQAISGAVKEYLNRYMRQSYHFLTDYQVVMPQYTSVTLEDKDTLKLSADSDKNLWIYEAPQEFKREHIKLEKDSILAESYNIQFYRMFFIGKDIVNPESSNSIKGAITGYLGKWKKEGERVVTVEGCDTSAGVTEMEVFNLINDQKFKSFEEAEAAISSDIAIVVNSKADIPNMQYSGEGILLTFTILNNKASVGSSCQVQDTCEEGQRTYKKTCKFDYTSYVDVLVKIESTAKEFPVYDVVEDGVLFKKPALAFVGSFSITDYEPLPEPVRIEDTTPPEISNVQVSDIGVASATITWETNEDTDSRVEYGETETYGLRASDVVKKKSHSVRLTKLTPGTTYHYKVSSTDYGNNKAESEGAQFTTKPVDGVFDITIKVTSPVERTNKLVAELAQKEKSVSGTVQLVEEKEPKKIQITGAFKDNELTTNPITLETEDATVNNLVMKGEITDVEGRVLVSGSISGETWIASIEGTLSGARRA